MTVWLGEMNGARKTVELHLRQPLRNCRVIRRQVFHAIVGPMTPALDPESTEPAPAVENEQRPVNAHGDILSRPDRGLRLMTETAGLEAS